MRQESVYGQVAFSACLTGLLALVLLPSFTAPIALVGLALTLTFTGFACDCVATAKDKDVAPKGLLFVWLIAAALLLSLATQTHNWQGVERVTIWVACCCGCITVKNRARGCSRQRQLIQSILLLFVTLALRALAERFYLYSMLRELAGGMGFEAPDAEYAGFFGSARARATFGQANGFAGFLLLLLPLIIAMSSVTLRSKKSWFFVVLSVLCLWASGSKGGTLVYIFIAGVCLLRWSGNLIVKRLARVLLAIAVVGLSACLLSLIDGALPSSLEGLFETFRLRQGYWITALSMIGSEGAIGVGAGLFGESFYLFTDTNTSFSRFAHNGYLGIAAEFGLIGILLVGILVWAWWKSKPVPTQPEPELDGIKRIPIEFIGAFLISAPSFSLNLLAEGGWWTACFTMLPIVLGLHHFIGRDVVTKTVARVDRLKQAAWFGVLAFLLHSLVDFDIQITGITATLALLIALMGPEKRGLGQRPVLSAASFILGLTLTMFWILGPQATQIQRLGPEPAVALASWPVDLRSLYRESKRQKMAPQDAQQLMRVFESLSPSFGHLPAFQNQVKMLREK